MKKVLSQVTIGIICVMLGFLLSYQIKYIINNLKFAGAEAISVNDIRVTAQTGIRTSGSFIRVGNTDRINPDEPIIIKVIGDSTKLKTEMEFQGFIENLIGNNYNASIEVSDSIDVEKTTDKITSDFLSVDSMEGE